MVGAKFLRRTDAFFLPQAVVNLQNNQLDTIWCKPAKRLSITTDTIFPNFVLVETRVEYLNDFILQPL
jgi:hypothetical protein